jgi:hypothetical protein
LGCPTLFLSAHPTSDRLSDEEIDAFHDLCDRSEGQLVAEVLHGRPEAPRRMSVLPATRSVPLTWLGEADEEAAIFGFALED